MMMDFGGAETGGFFLEKHPRERETKGWDPGLFHPFSPLHFVPRGGGGKS